MARNDRTSPPNQPDGESPGYTVIARRYRPQRFEDVVGQDHVVQSLRNAIRLNRVTHAYLFSGTRGVGKTSVARIFAKCLNCVHGPTEEPCNRCDVCRLISVGQDVDVVEIDGASNNGVEAVRELRQNAGLRPSRSRYKIYYIDEVHMLSTGAFNALLKTLEEPPEHVKFFFATTEPNRIPVTVLSRCQRYDFAGISPEQVVETLTEICGREGVEAEPEALRAVARRAAGSMRDAQSLLEQLLSAGGDTLTVEVVHQRLGTASDERLLDLVDALSARDPAAALRLVDAASNEGVQPTDLLNGLLEFLRDAMVLAAGGEGILLAATPRQAPRLKDAADRWSIDAVVAVLQIMAEARGRLRGSPHGRLLVELAVVRAARLEHFEELGDLIGRLSALDAGQPLSSPSPDVKKKPDRPETPRERVTTPVAEPPRPGPPAGPEVDAVAPPQDQDAAPVDLAALREHWPAFVKKLGLGLGIHLMPYNEKLSGFLATSAPNHLVFRVPNGYNHVAEKCDTPEGRQKIEQALRSVLHRPVSVRFERVDGPGFGADPAAVAGPGPAPPPRKRDEPLEGDPMVRKMVELFEARLLHVDDEDSAGAAPAV